MANVSMYRQTNEQTFALIFYYIIIQKQGFR